MDIYGGMPSRRVSARLRHPGPESTEGGTGWTFRATECDIADHVNNAAYWQPLEEELLAGEDPERLDVEIEYRAPAQPGAKRVVGDGSYRWIVGDGDELHASIRLGGGGGGGGWEGEMGLSEGAQRVLSAMGERRGGFRLGVRTELDLEREPHR